MSMEQRLNESVRRIVETAARGEADEPVREQVLRAVVEAVGDQPLEVGQLAVWLGAVVDGAVQGLAVEAPRVDRESMLRDVVGGYRDAVSQLHAARATPTSPSRSGVAADENIEAGDDLAEDLRQLGELVLATMNKVAHRAATEASGRVGPAVEQWRDAGWEAARSLRPALFRVWTDLVTARSARGATDGGEADSSTEAEAAAAPGGAGKASTSVEAASQLATWLRRAGEELDAWAAKQRDAQWRATHGVDPSTPHRAEQRDARGVPDAAGDADAT